VASGIYNTAYLNQTQKEDHQKIKQPEKGSIAPDGVYYQIVCNPNQAANTGQPQAGFFQRFIPQAELQQQ
jgi:hypothetical protein